MKPLAPLVLALFISLTAASSVAQQAPCQPSWIPTFGSTPGIDGGVTAFTVFDDGSGGGPALYAGGGDFKNAGGVAANRIVKWDGSGWSPLGSGMDDAVLALTVFDDGSGGGPALYAAGNFTSAGGVASNRIAKWDGSSWSPLGSGLNDVVRALAIFDDGSGGGPALYAAGNFTSAGGVSASNIAKWGGSSWSPVGSGMSGGVLALTVFDDGSGGGPALHAGGNFTSAGGVSANRIAQWDGSSWSPVGSGMDGSVRALTVYDDGGGGGPALHAAGDFTSAGGVSARRIAKWDGSSWSRLGSGIHGAYSGYILALTVFDDGTGSGPALYAGGFFGSAGGVLANFIARWNGSSWSAPGSGMNSTVEALTVFDDGSGGGPALYAGGDFSKAGGVAANHIARWAGSSWSTLGTGGISDVYALTVFDDGGGGPALYAGGQFVTAGGVAASRIAKWDGSSWFALASGVSSGPGNNSFVEALTVFDDGSGGGPALYAAGGFTTAGGVLANNIAKWDGVGWSALGSGTSGQGIALTVFDDGSGAGTALYAAGLFTSAGGVLVNNIARWDGSSWSALGSGLNSVPLALTVFDDGSGGGPALYAGGFFSIAGGVLANNIAKWDGSGWSALGSGVSGGVLALTVFDDGGGAGPALYAGGGSAPHVAKWDGATWSALGSGINGGVFALTAFDDSSGAGPALYASAVSAPYVAKWDGLTWSALGSGGSGMNSVARALTVFDDGSGAPPSLYAGGTFTTSASGDSYLARWGCPPPTPVTVFCTAKTTLVCGPASISATGVSSAAATSGFVIEAQPARGCRAGLLLYSSGPVQPGASFGGPGNGLLCLDAMGLRRAGPIESGGTSTFTCDGVMSIDMNRFHTLNWTATGCNPAPGQNNPAGFLGLPGITVNAQIWGRDSTTTGQLLSDGISWSIGP